MKKTFLLITILLLAALPVTGIIIFLKLSGINTNFFLNLSGFCLVVLGTFVSLAAGSGFKGIKSSFTTALNNKATYTKTSLLKAVYFFKSFYKSAIEWGILGLFIKLMINVYVIDSKSDILPQLGIAFLPVAYAIIISISICMPLIARLKIKLASV